MPVRVSGGDLCASRGARRKCLWGTPTDAAAETRAAKKLCLRQTTNAQLHAGGSQAAAGKFRRTISKNNISSAP